MWEGEAVRVSGPRRKLWGRRGVPPALYADPDGRFLSLSLSLSLSQKAGRCVQPIHSCHPAHKVTDAANNKGGPRV